MTVILFEDEPHYSLREHVENFCKSLGYTYQLADLTIPEEELIQASLKILPSIVVFKNCKIVGIFPCA